MTRRISAVAIAMAHCLLAWSVYAEEQWMKLGSPNGAVLVREFFVDSGTTIVGVEFTSTNVSGAFPEIAIVQGPLQTLKDAPRLATRSDVEESANGTVSCTWNDPVDVGQGGMIYVIVAVPATAALDPAIKASPASVPSGSFITEELIPIQASIGMRLLTSGIGKASQGTSDDMRETKIETFLSSGRPNPAKFATTVRFGVANLSDVDLSVYDVAGRCVRTIVRGPLAAGVYYRVWDGLDARQSAAPAGIYFVKLRVGGDVMSEKIVLLE